MLAELGVADDGIAVSPKLQAERVRAKREEVLEMICFRFGLEPGQLPALPPDVLAGYFETCTGRPPPSLSVLAGAAADFACRYRLASRR